MKKKIIITENQAKILKNILRENKPFNVNLSTGEDDTTGEVYYKNEKGNRIPGIHTDEILTNNFSGYLNEFKTMSQDNLREFSISTLNGKNVINGIKYLLNNLTDDELNYDFEINIDSNQSFTCEVYYDLDTFNTYYFDKNGNFLGKN